MVTCPHQVCRGYHRRSAHGFLARSKSYRPSCRSLPRQRCSSKPVRRPVEGCTSVPTKACHQVAVQVALEAPAAQCGYPPYQDCLAGQQGCRQVPSQACTSRPVRVPRQVVRRVCGGYPH